MSFKLVSFFYIYFAVLLPRVGGSVFPMHNCGDQKANSRVPCLQQIGYNDGQQKEPLKPHERQSRP